MTTRYEILNESGEVVNTILATEEFVSKTFGAGFFRALPEIVKPTPEPTTKLTVLEFRRRFTLEEKEAIYTAAEQSVLIKIWLDDLSAATFVQLDDPAIIEGVNGLVLSGIITEERASEILSGGTNE